MRSLRIRPGVSRLFLHSHTGVLSPGSGLRLSYPLFLRMLKVLICTAWPPNLLSAVAAPALGGLLVRSVASVLLTRHVDDYGERQVARPCSHAPPFLGNVLCVRSFRRALRKSHVRCFFSQSGPTVDVCTVQACRIESIAIGRDDARLPRDNLCKSFKILML